MIFRFSASAVIAVSLCGCASIENVPIEPTIVSTLLGKEVVAVKRPIPNFGAQIRDKFAMTSPVAILCGPLVVQCMQAIVITTGNSIVRENDLQDPAYQIADEVARLMEKKYGIKYVGIGDVEVTGDDLSVLSGVYQSFPLALDVKTIGWGLSYSVVTSDKYFVAYRARLRLVNTETTDSIAEASCLYRTREDDRPTYDELVGNGAIRLKGEFANAIAFCVRELSSKALLILP